MWWPFFAIEKRESVKPVYFVRPFLTINMFLKSVMQLKDVK